MKTLQNNKKLTTLLSLILFAVIPLTSYAADMWAETPELNNNNVPTVVTGSSTFTYVSPGVDMWAETPNFQTDREGHGVYIDIESRFISDYNPAKYDETPDLNTTSAAPQAKRVESILIVKEE